MSRKATGRPRGRPRLFDLNNLVPDSEYLLIYRMLELGRFRSSFHLPLLASMVTCDDAAIYGLVKKTRACLKHMWQVDDEAMLEDMPILCKRAIEHIKACAVYSCLTKKDWRIIDEGLCTKVRYL
jgi:hypothetical protein